ncbi:indoleacetate decarboxylase [Clostridium botulinum]|uniref:indoleacetate decarboxylase n=1 Tax=Clostridium botulinum TaxID=1491 RepID=UPI0004D7CFD3|nr:indoleacetate decarboxylase [Clostridium botulinum]KEI01606.1 formate acetyltransferase [Clostridium botulinum C/D str. BKT75002]KEI07940.1 formate acetyltransferase [Clostridium botulinum C/D str. BKT2873]KGM94362.1 formate acetyltransferase [Clostridium botulinum D str. CCUG 7971]KOC50665.1 formate acetyltransferase [Clostridium botulinum]KOC57022.1 formate acetyltransferase [Clostridium botulinum]
MPNLDLNLENLSTLKWPPTNKELEQEGFIQREISKEPTTQRGKKIKQRLLEARCMLDPEFSILYTEEWKKSEGEPLLIRRARSYKYAIENITPIILPDELITMQKTRYMRGAPVYLQYSQKFYPHMISNAEHPDDDVYDVGMGGGRKHEDGKGLIQMGIFGMKEEDAAPLMDCCKYWDGKCIEDESLKFLKETMPEYNDLDNAFKAVLYPPSVISIMEGRWVPAYDIAVEKGLESVIEECKKNIKNTLPTTREIAEKVIFWRATILVCEGVMNWAKNYANKALDMASKESDSQRKKELLKMSEALNHVPAKPARTFYEGLQAAWTSHIAIALDGPIVGLSPGRWGQLLYPLYKKDLKEGKITREEALELMELIRVKFSSEEYVSPRSWEALASGNLFQHMVVGGIDSNGKCSDNELEEIILEAGTSMQTIQPTLGIMFNSKTSNKLLMKAAECTKTGSGYPAWFNNEKCIEHLLQNHREEGITIEDARDVAIGGCVEMQMQGNCHGICHPAFFNEVKCLEIVLNDGIDPRTGIRCFESLGKFDTFQDLWNAWCRVEEKYLKVYMHYWNYVLAVHREINPLVMGSVLVKDCVKKGKPLDSNGARYNKTVTLLNSGMVNVANSLAAIKKLVYEDKKYSITEIKEAIQNNFGFESADTTGNFSMLEQQRINDTYKKLHKNLLNSPKFGNDDDYVDDLFVKLWNHYNSTCLSETTYLGLQWIPAALSISAHGPFGRVCGATPDGRVAGVSLTDGILSATPGTDVNGPIALLNSGIKLDSVKMRSVQLNMKLHPDAIKNLDGSKKLIDLIRTYFEQGGYHIQFNIVDSKMLRDAQKNPDNYRDLIVRVAGFSAYWVELAKPIQDEIIARTEYNSTGF